MKTIRGQALLEVAIFGAIIIMLLGILISYGLRYNYQQRLMQQAFRKSLSRAVSEPGVPVSSVIVSDKHIPSPTDTFGVGSVMPFTGSAGGIVRDYQMSETASDESSLPRVTININDREFSYKTAGFRYENNVPEANLEKYKKVYGSGNVEDLGSGDCLESEETTDPNTGFPVITCLQPTKNIRIIDSNAGEIIDYGSAVKQCRMIIDSAACVKECDRENAGVTESENEADCPAICSRQMSVPWYCATEECGLGECNLGATHKYNFVRLNQLFARSALKAMGLQQDYTQETASANILIRVEDTSGITTTDTLDWGTRTKREIISIPLGSTTGTPIVEEVTTEVSQDEVKSQKTDW